MKNNENMITIDQSLQNLQDAFLKYQQKQDEKMNHLQAAYQRIPMGQAVSETDTTFCDFVRKGLSSKSLTSSSNGGGYLIPSTLVYKIHEQIKATGSLREICAVIDITSDSYEVLVEKGGASVGWTQETQQRDETDLPELEKIHIPTFELYAKPKASQKILDDSAINIEEWIQSKIAQSMAVLENDAFLHGDGISKPKGLIAAVKEGRINITSTDLKDADALIECVQSLDAQFLPGACFVMSRSALSHIRLLKDPTTGRYLLQPSLEASMPTTLLGYPVILNDAMPAMQTGNIPILFGHFKQAYQIVDRKDLSLLRDPYSSKPFVEFYATKRVGADLIEPNAIKAIRIV